MSAARTKQLFRVYFSSEGKGYELYARKVDASQMPGFVAVEELVFGERSSLVVDPGDEALRREFSGVKRLHLPYHAVSRIDEVEKSGPGRVIPLVGMSGETPPGGLLPPLKR